MAKANTTSCLTEEQLAALRAHLLKDKAKLEADLADLGGKKVEKETPEELKGHFNVEYPESGSASDDDNAAEVSEFSDRLSLSGNLEKQLEDINKSLKAIDKGLYGVCKYCGKCIDFKRLEARPASSACISCKKLLTQEM